MNAPDGTEIRIGQKWREVDPRFNPPRIVKVIGFLPAALRVIILGPTGRKTTARAKRFNGMHNGYILEASNGN